MSETKAMSVFDALEETQGLLVSLLHEPRDTKEIKEQIRLNRDALSRGSAKVEASAWAWAVVFDDDDGRLTRAASRHIYNVLNRDLAEDYVSKTPGTRLVALVLADEREVAA